MVGRLPATRVRFRQAHQVIGYVGNVDGIPVQVDRKEALLHQFAAGDEGAAPSCM